MTSRMDDIGQHAMLPLTKALAIAYTRRERRGGERRVEKGFQSDLQTIRRESLNSVIAPLCKEISLLRMSPYVMRFSCVCKKLYNTASEIHTT